MKMKRVGSVVIALVCCFILINCFICYGESSVTGTAVSEQYEENAFTQDDPEDAIFNDLALTYNNVEVSPSLSETEYDAIIDELSEEGDSQIAKSHDNCVDMGILANSTTLKMKGFVIVNKKEKLTVSIYLQRKFTGGDWKTMAKAVGIKLGGLIHTTKVVSCESKKTSFWRLVVKTTGDSPSDDRKLVTETVLVNKKCIAYPEAYEPYSKRKVKVPPTNYDVNQKDRDPKFRQKYISYFENKYPNANINWKNYEIHHIRPLKYGGSNAMTNGIALKKTVHSRFNAWWNNY